VPGAKFLDIFLSRKSVPGTIFSFNFFDFFDFAVKNSEARAGGAAEDPRSGAGAQGGRTALLCFAPRLSVTGPPLQQRRGARHQISGYFFYREKRR
jgi:hypothetical protein